VTDPLRAVRPFTTHLVRQEQARRTVTAMSESQDESGVDLYRVAVDLAAYADFPASLYVYRQARGRTSHIGLVCDVAVEAIAQGQVRGHEAVHQLRVDALIWHHGRPHSPPALVKLLHRAGPEFTRALAQAQLAEPTLDFAGPHGFQQTLWRLPEGPETRALVDELAVSRLYIADGHHRTAAALEEWRAAGRPPEAGLLCVLYPTHGLTLSAFHRRISGQVDPGRLVALLRGVFDVEPAVEPPSPAVGAMGLYVDSHWYAVRLAAARPTGVGGLDVTMLQTQVLDRLDPAPPGRVRTVATFPAATPLADLVARCDVDRGALFTLAPPSVETVIEVADAGEVMPPKATFFEPKPAAGIFLRR
jgi:uncharacterized protein (DUF1015 family)